MDFLKKNKGLSAVFVVSALIFAGGVYLLITAMGSAEDAEAQKQRAERDVRSALAVDLAPTRENVAAAEANVENLREALSTIQNQLRTGTEFSLTSDPVQLITRIQRHISDSRRLANEAEVRFPSNSGFGFDRYVESSSFPNVELAPVVDKQRQILEYLITKLIEAGPSEITGIRREALEAVTRETTRGRTTARRDGTSSFTIDPAISARVDGAINTLAFELSFTGFTESFQNFLNELATFEMPIVVRSVQVSRAAPAAEGRRQQQERSPQTIDDIFGGLGGTTAPGGRSAPDLGTANRPVIEDNESNFTLVVEFVEVLGNSNDSPETAQR